MSICLVALSLSRARARTLSDMVESEGARDINAPTNHAPRLMLLVKLPDGGELDREHHPSPWILLEQRLLLLKLLKNMTR